MLIQSFELFLYQVEKRLAKRLEAGIRAWTKCLLGDDGQGMEDNMDTDGPAKVRPGGDPKITVRIILYFTSISKRAICRL